MLVGWCWVAEEVDVEGTKIKGKKNKRVPHPIPNHRASSQPLLGKEGSAICDRFS
jgi:hypothetical protein